MPSGRIKFYDPDKKFGFVASDEGDAFLSESVIPAEYRKTVQKGTKVEYSVADTKKGPHVLNLKILDKNVPKKEKKSPQDMALITEDLSKLLEEVNQSFKAGRYPDQDNAQKLSSVLRAVADDLD